ncbi:hypothetical protein PHET_05862 [Paragonimus heterotremus]|uniref:Uncharacterized protein n=1 Tax=Paragonimus heterotremus TaxID=100268 RepID=A0A8J4SX29_9TREM|nr:hypothetical protein PHET_05862 [Paragonimus heterotremus]
MFLRTRHVLTNQPVRRYLPIVIRSKVRLSQWRFVYFGIMLTPLYVALGFAHRISSIGCEYKGPTIVEK